jgi:hypothetical protein
MENEKIRKIIRNLQEQDAKDYHDGMINGLSEDSVRAFLSMLDEDSKTNAKTISKEFPVIDSKTGHQIGVTKEFQIKEEGK